MLLENLFSNVLDMSITASYVAIAVIVIRFIIKKAPKSFSFAIWIPVLFRLVCPISFISNLSVFNFINRDSFRKIEGVSQSITVNNTISNIRSGQVSDNIAGNAVTNIANNTTISQGIGNNFMYLVSILWMIGIQILIVYFIVSYIKTYSKIKTATLYNENVYESDQIDTAFVFGLIKPKIYIPVNLTESEKIYIIEHEKVHIKRKDYVTKIIAFLILIIHWFNPIMWISFILMTRDMEMSCDERVMKNLGEDIKTNYSYSLLNLAVNKGNTFNIPLSFSENNIKSRIENVLNYKKTKKWFILIIALAIVASTVFLISNPKNNDVDNSKSLIQNIQTLKEESQNRNVLIKNIGDITDFKWDYIYSFEPYTSKENIEKAIGFKSDKIKESVNEGTNQVIFTKGKEVVCYIYGYPDDSVYFDFSSLYNYYSISNKYADVLSMDSVKYIRLSSKGNHPFLLTQFDNLQMSYMIEASQKQVASVQKAKDNYNYDKVFIANNNIAIEKKNVSKEEIAKILYEENIRLKIYFNEGGKSMISDYRIKNIKLDKIKNNNNFVVAMDFDLQYAKGYEKYDAGNGTPASNRWTVDKYNLLNIEKLDKDIYLIEETYTG